MTVEMFVDFTIIIEDSAVGEIGLADGVIVDDDGLLGGDAGGSAIAGGEDGKVLEEIDGFTAMALLGKELGITNGRLIGEDLGVNVGRLLGAFIV